MTTKLTIEEFESRLAYLTRFGEPTIMGTPFAPMTFNFSSKPFYGVFDKTTFRLGRNRTLPPTGYIIVGSYSASGTKTVLEYEVKPILFAYYWIRIAPILGLLVFNAILYFNLKTFQWDLILPVNGMLALIALAAIGADRLQKKRIDKKFQEEFEVEY